MFELLDNGTQGPVIKAIGVGGGGGNAISHMVHSTVEGVEFITANTDAQALNRCESKIVLQIGQDLTAGMGAGADPDVGRRAALEDRERIQETIQGAELLFVTAGMGGGTGTGAAPIIAQIAKEMGILTIAVVTKPFAFEGKRRMRIAEEGIAELAEYVDSLITIPNEKLLEVFEKEFTVVEAFNAANDVLLNATRGISDLFNRPGMINLDFADVKTVMSNGGVSMMGTGIGRGAKRARDAVEAAIKSPLLDEVRLDGAHGILLNIAADRSLTLSEFQEISKIVTEYADEDAKIVIGTSLDPNFGEDVFVTVVATGLAGRTGNVARANNRAEELARNASVYEQQAPELNNDLISSTSNWNDERNSRPSIQKFARREQPDFNNESDLADLKIPAFLRRKSD